MAESVTRPNTRSVVAFLDGIEEADRRADARALLALMQKITGEAPLMWGDSIVGFGRYHYRYASGREGDACLTGFSPRRAEFSVYLTCVEEAAAARDALLPRLGKHRMGKACLYVKRLRDIDLGVLEELVRLSVRSLRAAYPDP